MKTLKSAEQQEQSWRELNAIVTKLNKALADAAHDFLAQIDDFRHAAMKPL